VEKYLTYRVFIHKLSPTSSTCEVVSRCPGQTRVILHSAADG